MKAVILAAGEGTRMRPFTRGQPKVMLPVGNRPFLEYLVRALARNGIRDIIMVVGYHRERIMSYFKDGDEWSVNIQYVHQDKQLGTAHALRCAEDYLKDETGFLLLAGDNLIEEEDIRAIIDSEDEEVLLVTRSTLSTKYGVVDERNHRVISITEKDVLGYEEQIFTGIGKFSPSIFDFLYEDVYQLTSLIQERINHGSIRSIHARTWMDAVYPQDLLRLNNRVLEDLPAGYGGIVEPGVMFKGNVHVGEGTITRANTYLKGPIAIGEGADIGPSSAIFGPVSIGENSTIGPFCEIRNSIIMDNVTISMGSVIENAVIGSGCTLGARFTTRKNRNPHAVGRKNLRLEGIAIGEDCLIEENVTVDNGITIGNGVCVEAGKHVNRPIEDGTIII